MSTEVYVTKNAVSWYANWFDSTGKRRRQSLGSRRKYSKGEARQRAADLAASFAVRPGSEDAKDKLLLSDWKERFMDQRNDLGPGTRALYEQTWLRLARFFGERADMAKINRAGAADFKAWVAKQPANRRVSKGRTAKQLSAQSVARTIRDCKVIWNAAVDQDLIRLNAFDRLSASAPKVSKQWYVLEHADLERLLAKLPNAAWRALVGLCRLAGLRRSEAYRLLWDHVDLEHLDGFGCSRPELVVVTKEDHRGERTETTKSRTRRVPIDARLTELLLDARREGTGEGRVCDGVGSWGALDRRLQAFAKQVGLPKWAKPYHTLRKNLETEWLAKHPAMTVCKWLGHGPTVAAQHYHQVRDEDMALVSGQPRGPRLQLAAG